MYILYTKNKKNKKLKMIGWYHEYYILKKFGCTKPYKHKYYYCDSNDIKNIMEVK